MIHRAVQHIVDEIQAYLSLRTGSADPEQIIQGSIVEQDGSVSDSATGRVVMTLINVEEDRISRPTERSHLQANGTYRFANPEIRLNLYLLFIANHKDYDEGLKALSFVIAFFQHRNYFDRSNTPSLDERIEKLTFELFSLTFEQQSYLWGTLGAKYVPSILYRMRLVAIEDETIESEAPPIFEIDINEPDTEGGP